MFPDESADRGDHTVKYGIIPDEKGDLSIPLIHSSILNRPPVIYRGKKEESPLAYIESRNVVIDSIKESIDGKGIVVRLYEALGFRTVDNLSLSFPYEKVDECNLVEEDRRKLRSLRLEFSPFEIKTLYFTR